MQNRSQDEILENSSNGGLFVTETMRKKLKQTGVYALVMAVMGFISLGFLALAAIVTRYLAVSGRAGLEGMAWVSWIYVILVIVYFFPMLYLLRFSTQIQTAMKSDDNETLGRAVNNLHAHYQFQVFAIVGLVVMYIVFVAMLAMGLINFDLLTDFQYG